MRAALATETGSAVKLKDGLNGKRDEKFCQVRSDGISFAPLLKSQSRPTDGFDERKFESKQESG